MQKKIVTLAVSAALALAASGAYAGNAGPNDVRLGVYFVHFEANADDISGPYVPSSLGLNLHVNNIVTPYFAYVRSFSTHIDVELAFGYPPLTKTEGRGPAKVGSVPYNGQIISTARWLSPTLLLEYVFGDAELPLAALCRRRGELHPVLHRASRPPRAMRRAAVPPRSRCRPRSGPRRRRG